jgi:hypothetical protein
MHTKVTEFFQQYAVAMQDKELALLKSIYRLPFIIVQDELKSVISFEQKLESNLTKVLGTFEQLGITNIKAKVKKAIHLSNDIHFANVNWTFENEQGEVQITYNTSYMLSLTEECIKVITVIIDDENDTYLQLID